MKYLVKTLDVLLFVALAFAFMIGETMIHATYFVWNLKPKGGYKSEISKLKRDMYNSVKSYIGLIEYIYLNNT